MKRGKSKDACMTAVSATSPVDTINVRTTTSVIAKYPVKFARLVAELSRLDSR